MTIQRFKQGDAVRIDIPNETDADHEVFHDRRGEVVDVINDDAGDETGDVRDSVLYQIRFESGEEMGFRWRDLRPAEELD